MQCELLVLEGFTLAPGIHMIDMMPQPCPNEAHWLATDGQETFAACDQHAEKVQTHEEVSLNHFPNGLTEQEKEAWLWPWDEGYVGSSETAGPTES